MTQSATVKIPGNVSLNGGELQNAKLQSLVSKDTATEADFWYDSVNHKPVYHNGTTVKEFGKEYAAGTNVSIENGTISATDTTYTFSTGLTNTSGTVTANIQTSIRPSTTASDTTMPSEKAVAKELVAKKNVYLATVNPNWEELDDPIIPAIVNNATYVEDNGNHLIVNFGNKVNMTSAPKIKVNGGTARDVYVNGVNSGIYNILKGNVEFVFYNNAFYATTASPTVGNGKVIYQKNGTAFSTINVNQTSTTTVNYTIPTAVSDLSDASDYAKKSDLVTAYTPAGNVNSASDLPTLSASVLGNVYHVTTSFNTTSNFVEGSGKTIQVGNDIAVVDVGTGSSHSYKFNVYGDFVDISGKQDALTPGSNITIIGNTISATDTTYTFSTGLTNTSGTVAVTDYSKLAKKYTTVNPALTSSNGVVTWTITNNATSADVDVSIYEVGSTSNTKIYPAIDVNASNIVVTMLSSSNVSAGALKAVTVG